MKVVELMRDTETGILALMFICPGCESYHRVPVSKERKTKGIWLWNGSLEKPTLMPSVDHPGLCHYILTDGIMDFKKDSKHALAGKHVPLEEFKG